MSAPLNSAAVAELDQMMDKQRKLGGLQVSGLTNFSEERWREAILHFLFGVWGNKYEVMYRPKICFGQLTLRLDPDDREYFAYGLSRDDELPDFPSKDRDSEFVVGCSQTEVEQGLIRFVKNDQIKKLTIALRNHGTLVLWKKERRGQYGCFAQGIPNDIGKAFALR